jgi:CBS domain-containing protein
MINLKSIRVKDVMTSDVHSIEVPGHRLDALNLMKHRDISGLPVVAKGTKNFLGIITRHDIYEKPDKEQIAMLYNTDIQTITQHSTVAKLVDRFLESKQYWFPVLGTDKKTLAGIVTPSDLLKFVEVHGKGQSVIDFMGHRSCIPIYGKTPLTVALHTLRITRIPALPIINGSAKIIGIVSDMDVFRMLNSEENTKKGITLDAEDDDWTWEGIRNFQQIISMPSVKLPNVTVDEIMVKKVKFLYPHSDVARAAKTMRINNIGQLPVCDSNDVLIGMIYNYDLLPVLQA